MLFATAVVALITDHGHSIKVRALLDQGSEISLIQESLVQLLHLSRSRASIPIISIGAQHAGSTRGSVTLRFQSRFDTSSDFSVTAFVLPKVTGRIPSKPVSSLDSSHRTSARGFRFRSPRIHSPTSRRGRLWIIVKQRNQTRTLKRPSCTINRTRLDHFRAGRL